MESYDETINRLLDAYSIKSTNEAKEIRVAVEHLTHLLNMVTSHHQKVR